MSWKPPRRWNAAGEDVIHLEVGEPDFDTPECIKEACIRALHEGKTHYTHSLGLLELREAICEHYLKRYGVVVSPDQVLVTSGTSPAMMILFATLLEKGSEVIISDPHYACYPNFIRFFEGSPVCVPVHECDGFQYTPDGDPGKDHPADPGDPDQFSLQSDRQSAEQGKNGGDRLARRPRHLR